MPRKPLRFFLSDAFIDGGRRPPRQLTSGMRNNTDWRDILSDWLIESGIQGVPHWKIISRFQRRANAKEITDHLEALQAEDRVQRFRVDSGGMVWRATTKMLEN